MKANISVLVSGGGTNLQALIDAQKSGIIKSGEISLVISNNPGAYALERAKNAGIKTAVCNKKELGDAFESQLIALLEENKTDIIVLAGFMCILSENFTTKYADRIIRIQDGTIISDEGDKSIEENKEFKLENAKLPFFYSFKMGIGSLLHKKIILLYW